MSAPHLAFVLAAGQSKRMRSKTPKILHPCAGKPLLRWSLDAAIAAGARPVVVLSPEIEAAIREILPPGTAVAIQSTMRGTGDAVRVAVEASDARGGEVFVLYGDTPTLSPSTLERLRALRAERGAALALLTAKVGTENGYGRIVRDAAGDVQRIVEVRLATAEERQLPESNLGAYAIDLAWLRDAIARLAPNATGEVFFTDIVAVAIAAGKPVAAFCTPDPGEGMGVNTRVELAAAEMILRRRIREKLMLEGVTFHDPESTQVDDTVRVAADTVIERGCVLEGATVIGADTRVGPYSILRDTTVGARCIVEASVLEGATLEDDVRIGPFSHLRPGAYLEQGVGMGNFGEVKAARLRKGTKMHHFSYIGDADVGERVNIGAGTITMNYDGANKHRTTIGNDAFIGSDTLLRAPITIGEGAMTGAGAVVTKDVAPGMLAVGVPARSIKKAEKKIKT
ncbi:MAG TPA: UDP-N-acetylglucosamine diphosphorylase/glucosamine-1-phosphate N-acetyltransferase [Chloroflexi bacterium]|jgi:bifunctional UDP-N-acetylglucosamine pyrophosphorylase/glucosamine-1-phosphate N-acetyltransferase|nr:UDP-N-acetylglucosamine diphosphorylase/glucosamine-1-phosphate N-acetyltransferase [Chloroflexota bacterium]HAL26849.1 UDP-N-acetylglucosamine diphosphorylase/glucosamine-1-phosphate N-acetyltransferase [Chloroflexota bacterium]